jgi:DNA replication protein DnaC
MPSLDADSDTDTDDTEIEPPSSPLKPKNAYKHLKSFLRLCANTDRATPNDIIGREEEKDALRAYFSMRSKLDVGMYVSGPPGTGKTALVTAMGREVATKGYRVVEIGCMGLKVGDVWRRLGEGLGCGQTENEVTTFMTANGGDMCVSFFMSNTT